MDTTLNHLNEFMMDKICGYMTEINNKSSGNRLTYPIVDATIQNGGTVDLPNNSVPPILSTVTTGTGITTSDKYIYYDSNYPDYTVSDATRDKETIKDLQKEISSLNEEISELKKNVNNINEDNADMIRTDENGCIIW